MAQDFVEGVEPEGGNPTYKPLSLMRMPSAGNQPTMNSQPFAIGGGIDENSRERVKHSTYHPESFTNNANMRDKSPAHRT